MGFPRLHFFNIAQAPVLSPKNKGYTKLFIQELTKQVWSGKQFFSNVPIEDGKFLTASLVYRGDIATQETDENVENADQTYVIDNEALYSISVNLLKEDHPTYSFLNYMISQVQMGCTASLRFAGQLNGVLRKLGVNLIPFPRLHFFNIAQAPVLSPKNKG